MGATVVIVEDEEDLLELIEYNLQKHGFDTVGFLSLKGVEKFLHEEKTDLIIMDRNLPNAEGSEFIAKLRDEGCYNPVIFLSAKNADTEIEEGFLRGGDDYVTKPFNMNELVYRIKAVLKRSSNSSRSNILYYRDLELHVNERKFFKGDKEIVLTKLEFNLINIFMSNINIVLRRDFLLQNAWEDDIVYQNKTVNVAINRLKHKIDPTNAQSYITSVWGVGYKFC